MKNLIKTIKTKGFFPESLGQKHGCALYRARYSIQDIQLGQCNYKDPKMWNREAEEYPEKDTASFTQSGKPISPPYCRIVPPMMVGLSNPPYRSVRIFFTSFCTCIIAILLGGTSSW